MKDLIRELRIACGLSQEEFAEEIRSSFATVNRWENLHNAPSESAQKMILKTCHRYGVNVSDIVVNRLKSEAASIRDASDCLILYHGSKFGIEGDIMPKSRTFCDFGSGFYMGTDPLQSLTLVCDYPDSKFYMLSFEQGGLNTLELTVDLDWAMYVAYHRGKLDEIRGSKLYQRFAAMERDKDIIIGNIADDRMFYVLDNFFQGQITDAALVDSLSALQLGKQYVAVTQKSCEHIKIEREVELSYLEKESLKETSEKMRNDGVVFANTICAKHRRDGRFFDEILESEAAR